MREIAIQAGHLQLIRSAFPIEGIAWKLKGRRLGDNAACCFKVTGVCAEKRCVVVALGILRDKPTGNNVGNLQRAVNRQPGSRPRDS